MKTNYTIKPKHNQLAVYQDNKIVMQGFGDKESALHSIWVTEGKTRGHFYICEGGVVERVEG